MTQLPAGIIHKQLKTTVKFELHTTGAGCLKRFFYLIRSRAAEICDEDPDPSGALEQIADYVSMLGTILIGYDLHDEVSLDS